jgi:hypothetical protein
MNYIYPVKNNCVLSSAYDETSYESRDDLSLRKLEKYEKEMGLIR